MSFPAKQVVDGFIEAMAKEPHNFRLTASHLLLPPAMKARLQSEAAANASSISDNPLFAGSLRQTYAGMPVEFSDILPTVIRYDWSDCRSPSRAKRRHARGIKTRVKIIHQDVAYLITKKFEYELQKMYLNALSGD